MAEINLRKQWLVREAPLEYGPEMAPRVQGFKDGWMTADLPCDVHMPLMEAGIIQDPVVADHFEACHWIEERSWWFKKTFHADGELLRKPVVELELDSLDARADIFLNGVHLGHHLCAFYPFLRDVKPYLQEGENTLLVRLTSGLEHVSDQDIARVKPYVSTEGDRCVDSRGDKRRAFIRKPQYVYGWDWGPRIATCGIMQGGRLKAYDTVIIRHVRIQTRSFMQNISVLEFALEIENMHPYTTADAVVRIALLEEGSPVHERKMEVLLRSGLNYFNTLEFVQDLKRWWPNGLGEQPLYTVQVSVEAVGVSHAYPPFKIGVRTITLQQNRFGFKGDISRDFTFVVNDVPIFCKGGNWIPADSIYARVTDEKYDALIREARDCNLNMLRIWGGGIYERDVFYEKCDAYGILIWHDFMFSCAMYPDDQEWFKQEAEREMDHQTRRLVNHAALALWCGNNENHWGYAEWHDGVRKGLFFGGGHCYNIIAPRVVQRNCPHIPYWNSSPYGGVMPNDNNVGDRHHWGDCTMNAEMEKRITPEEYDKVTSKFVSEYGYIGPCSLSTIETYHGGAPVDRNGRIWRIHNNTFEKETVPAGIAKHYKDPALMSLEEYLLYAGLCQGLMLSYSLEALRYKTFCAGGLFWMYDDCWGEVGWTIIDYYLKRKPAYHYVRRALAPVKLILRKDGGAISVVGINETSEEVSFSISYGYSRFDGSQKNAQETLLILPKRSRKEVLRFKQGIGDPKQGFWFVRPEGTDQVLPAVLRTGVFKALQIPLPAVEIDNLLVSGTTVEFLIKSEVYAHAVHFGLPDTAVLSDEYFDLLPGEARTIVVHNLPEGFDAGGIKPKAVTV